MLILAWLGCGGGDGKGDGDASTPHSASISDTDEGFERCVRRCSRGSEGEDCDAAAITAVCEDYCVDPPPLPAACDPFYQEYEACVAGVEEWTCLNSPARVDDVVVPVPADAYECRLESVELSSCSAIPDPGCAPVLNGVGAACGMVATLCNANGATFDADLLCDGTICSLLVDDGSGPVDSTLARADQLCAELTEKDAVSSEVLAKFLVTLLP